MKGRKSKKHRYRLRQPAMIWMTTIRWSARPRLRCNVSTADLLRWPGKQISTLLLLGHLKQKCLVEDRSKKRVNLTDATNRDGMGIGLQRGYLLCVPSQIRA